MANPQISMLEADSEDITVNSVKNTVDPAKNRVNSEDITVNSLENGVKSQKQRKILLHRTMRNLLARSLGASGRSFPGPFRRNKVTTLSRLTLIALLSISHLVWVYR